MHRARGHGRNGTDDAEEDQLQKAQNLQKALFYEGRFGVDLNQGDGNIGLSLQLLPFREMSIIESFATIITVLQLAVGPITTMLALYLFHFGGSLTEMRQQRNKKKSSVVSIVSLKLNSLLCLRPLRVFLN